MDTSKYIDRAEKEAGRKNYDLAISIFDQVLSLEPNSGAARTGKRRAELAKFAKSYPSPMTAQFKNLGHSVMIGIAKLLRMHGAAASQAEKALSNDPRNVRLNLSLGHSLLKAGHEAGAEAAFAVVTEFDKNDIDSLKILGKLYYDGKKYDQSLECYERVLKVSPRDQEAIKMRKNLAAEGAIKSGGFENAASARDLAKSKDQMDQLEKRQKLIRNTEDLGEAITELEQELAANDGDADGWLRLGALCHQARRLDEAEKAYAKALELNPSDYDTANRHGDVKMQALDSKVRELRDAMKAGDETVDDDLRLCLKDRRTFRVVEFRRRVNSHPTDTSLRFKLGQYLLDAHQVDEAITELQLVVKDPRKKYQAMTLMGHAFLRKGLGDLAIKQLDGALEGQGGVNEKNLELVYTLAKAHEGEGNMEEALNRYTQIFEIDISFKDVSDKIKDLRDSLKNES
ncbi:MAG: tetratricopeptide (TPR) repeat protein [Planctomycetota bacterium]|jgi:tetratricopeptide (TPR) repeat protein